MGKISNRRSRRKTPWDATKTRTETQDFLYHHYKEHYAERHPALNKTGEENRINSFIPENCPYCEGKEMKRAGYTGNPVQRYKCLSSGCGRTFTPIAGTIFDGHKISISEWMEYTLNLLRYVSINADSWHNKNAFTTSRYWLEKIFLILEDYDQGGVLSGRVWLDETYYSVRTDDIERKTDGTKLRGLSKNQLCIGVACTENRILCVLEGTGQPTKRKTYRAFKDRIAVNSTLIHDKYAAHSLLVEKLQLCSESYDSKDISKLPDSANPLHRVNEVHARLKDFLYAHTSFDRESLQGYLNLFAFAMNPPVDHLEKVELLLNRALKTRKILRYRRFYHME